MEIVNDLWEDNHIHSFNFSDWLHTIDEIVRYAGQIGLKKITITDHSQQLLDSFNFSKKSSRYHIYRWKNVFNDVQVNFGIEGDLLNEKGDICDHIQGEKSNFLILSVHNSTYKGVPQQITEWYVKAIEANEEEIKCLGHICRQSKFSEYLDVEKITKIANKYNIPLELNGANLLSGKTDLAKLDIMLKNAKDIMINSDTHSLWELETNCKEAYRYLRDRGYI